MKYFYALGLFSVLASCASGPFQRTDIKKANEEQAIAEAHAAKAANEKALREKMHAEADQFNLCMKKAALNYSQSASTAFEIAEAAQAKCSLEFLELERQSKIFIYSATGADPEIIGAKMAAEFLKDAKDRVIQTVVEKRMKK